MFRPPRSTSRPWLAALALLLSGGPAAEAQSGLLREVEEGVPLTTLASYGPELAVADFDGDGDPDLLRRDGVLFNDGGGRFSGAGNAPGGPFACADRVAVADYDFDGDLDVIGDACAGVAFLALNTGAGSFMAGLPPPVPLTVSAMDEPFVANLNGDALPDVVAERLDPPTDLFGWINTGGGAFVHVPFPLGPFSPSRYPLAVGDFDGNGRDDVALMEAPSAGSPATLRVATWNGSAFAVGPPVIPFPAGFRSLGAADWNGDGFDDLLVSEQLAAGPPWGRDSLLPGGAGGLGPVAASSVHSVAASAILPFDRDGVPPLEALRCSSALHIVSVGVPAGTAVVSQVPSVGTWGRRIFVADFDADGDQDAMGGTPPGRRRVLFNGNGVLVDPDGTFDALFCVSPDRHFLCDFDGDGDDDAVATSLSQVRLNDGRGRFSPATSLPPSPPPPHWVTVGCVFDLDGDGRQDLMTPATGVLPQHRIYRNTTGGWYTTIFPASSFDARRAICGDVDADGDQDVVIAAYTAGIGCCPTAARVELFRNAGGGAWIPQVLDASHLTRDVAFADFEGDGDLDIVQANLNYATPDWSVVRLNDGTGTFAEAPLPFQVQAFAVAAGDLDQDTDLDLVLDGVAWIRSGAAWAPAPNVSPGGPAAFDAHQLADLDSDGMPELLTAAGFDAGLGPGGFGTRTPWPAYTWLTPLGGLGVRDLDRDGDLDVALAVPVVLWNTTRHLSRGSPARPGRPGSLEVLGAPNALWQLAVSLGPATPAFPVPPWGVVMIDPGSAVFLPPSSLAANGSGSLTIVCPNNPALVGASLWWQALMLSESRLTGVEETVILGF